MAAIQNENWRTDANPRNGDTDWQAFLRIGAAPPMVEVTLSRSMEAPCVRHLASEQESPPTGRVRAGLPWWQWIAVWILAASGWPLSAADTNLTARLTFVHDNHATTSFVPSQTVVRRMLDRGIKQHTGHESLAAAWKSLVASRDIVGIKVVSAPGPTSGTRPAVVQAVVESLIEAGHQPGQIILWDKSAFDLENAGFTALATRLGIRCTNAVDAGWDSAHFYENSLLGQPVFGDLEYGQKGDGIGRKSHVTQLVSKEITRVISIAPTLNHNLTAVHGHLHSLALGSVDNTLRFAGHGPTLSEVIPELFALPEVGDKLVLCITDALICQYRGEERALLHYAVALNELRFGRDPVALDVITWGDIERARRANPTYGEKTTSTELFQNAELLELGVANTNRITIHHE
ncbi:MAG: DUF362 domain-containing protein [Pedosphaera sp.]|nr:DUF362 domain-containing protein [Pedosphaera sp.]